VIQPERSTSATPAMVSSSMVGRVKGRKGRADAAEGADIFLNLLDAGVQAGRRKSDIRNPKSETNPKFQQ
jgi:hypothetical protein